MICAQGSRSPTLLLLACLFVMLLWERVCDLDAWYFTKPECMSIDCTSYTAFKSHVHFAHQISNAKSQFYNMFIYAAHNCSQEVVNGIDLQLRKSYKPAYVYKIMLH
jgi:hypothetical protein